MHSTVLIADDHELFRSGLKQLLIDQLELTHVREASSFDAAVEQLTSDRAIDLILMDLRMPGMSGAEAISALRDGFPHAKLVVVSALEERAEILASLAAGAHGYIPKSLNADQIAEALRTVIAGGIFAPAVLGRRSGEAAAPVNAVSKDEFTPRQKDVLAELLKGISSKEIARTLGIAEGTVKIHLAAIYRSLNVRTRAEAIAKLAGIS